MTVYGVTGPHGFLGFHARALLHARGARAVRLADRHLIRDEHALDQFLDECDHVVHIAGVNRGEDADVYTGNVGLAETIAAAKRRSGARFSLSYANSAQSEGDGNYGRSKLAASEILRCAQEEADDAYVDVVLPHLFGEYGRPFYNSGVTTFAHLLATGGTPEIHEDGQLDLVHAQVAANELIEADVEGSSRVVLTGEQLRVSEALELLQSLAANYVSGCQVPDVSDPFALRMFNMFRSQLYSHRPSLRLTVHRDARGGFYESVRAFSGGQTSISTTVPGVTRGDHFHFDKVERFIVVAGEAEIKVRRLFDDVVQTFDVSGDDPAAIDMPPLHTHNITNTGSGELVTLFWSNDHFDPRVPDTFPEPVARMAGAGELR